MCSIANGMTTAVQYFEYLQLIGQLPALLHAQYLSSELWFSATPRHIPPAIPASGQYPPADRESVYTLSPREQSTNPAGEHRGNAVQTRPQRITNVNLAQGRHANETSLRNASDRQSPGSGQTSANDQTSYSPADRESIYTLFPRDPVTNPTGEHQGNAAPNRSHRTTNVNQVQRRHANESLLRNASDKQSPASGQTSANDQPSCPPGTREIVTRGDRTYYLDINREVISVASARQQETRARHGQDTPADLTVRFASMSTEGRSSEGSERYNSPRNPSDQGASARATAGDLRVPSRHTSDPRNSSQSDDHDPQALSARPAMARHSSRGPVIIAQDERSQSRERHTVRQLQRDDDDDDDDDHHESPAEPVQVSRRPSLPQQSYGETDEQARGQVQRPVSDEGPVQRPNSVRRPSMNQGSNLATISESGDLKATKIVGDNKGRSEVMDDRKFCWLLERV